MTKAEYLQTLSAALSDQLPQTEINEITGDYAEYFDAGVQEGKTIDKLIHDFGSPDVVAREILQDKSPAATPKHRYVWLNPPLGKLLAVAAVWLLLHYMALRNFSFAATFTDHILTVLLPVLLLAGRYDKIIKRQPTKRVGFYMKTTAFMLAFLTFVTAGIIAYSFNIIAIAEYRQEPSILWRIFDYTFLSVMVLSLPCIAWILYLSKAFCWAKGLLFYISGLLFTVADITHLLRALNSPDALFLRLLRSLSPFAAGLLFTVVVVLILNLMKNGKIGKGAVRLGRADEKGRA